MNPFARFVAPLLCLFGMFSGTLTAAPFDFSYNGYFGAVGVVGDEDDCEIDACQGVLGSALFYGLSLRAGYGPVGAQVIVSQDVDDKPEVALAQMTLDAAIGGVRFDLRGGQIINPLGLYGANRIKPTARTGALLPQSLLLNAYFDSLSLTDIGGGLNIGNGTWVVKLAAFEPQDEQFETTTGGSPGMLGGALGILPVVIDDPTAMDPMTVTNTRTSTSYYAGAAYDDFFNRADIGLVRLNFDGSDVDAYNVGYERRFVRWLVSAEYLHTISNGENSNTTRGFSLTSKYQGDGWEAFVNWVRFIQDDVEDPQDFNVGVGYYHDPWAFIVAIHHLRDTGFGDADDDNLTTGAISVGYRWR